MISFIPLSLSLSPSLPPLPSLPSLPFSPFLSPSFPSLLSPLPSYLFQFKVRVTSSKKFNPGRPRVALNFRIRRLKRNDGLTLWISWCLGTSFKLFY